MTDAFPKTKEQWGAAILLLLAGTGVGGFARPAIDAVALEGRLARTEQTVVGHDHKVGVMEAVVSERGETLARIEAQLVENAQRLARLESKIDRMGEQQTAKIGD